MRYRRCAYTIYDHARGDGWILTAQGDSEMNDFDERVFQLVLYYTDEQRVETVETTDIDYYLRQYLDVGAQLGSYEAEHRPEADVRYDDQHRGVRMQRHAPDIMDEAGHARGLSPTIAVRAAEQFGSTWREKSKDEWQDRVRTVGAGRAERIVNAIND